MQNVERRCGRKSKRRLTRYQSCICICLFIFHHIASIDYHLLSRALPLLGCSTCRVMKCHQHQNCQERDSNVNPLRAWQPAASQTPGVLHAVDDGTVAPKIASEGLICGEAPNPNRQKRSSNGHPIKLHLQVARDLRSSPRKSFTVYVQSSS
jgi:hypothetical protein